MDFRCSCRDPDEKMEKVCVGVYVSSAPKETETRLLRRYFTRSAHKVMILHAAFKEKPSSAFESYLLPLLVERVVIIFLNVEREMWNADGHIYSVKNLNS